MDSGELDDLKAALENVNAPRIGLGFYLPEVQELKAATENFLEAFTEQQTDDLK